MPLSPTVTARLESNRRRGGVARHAATELGSAACRESETHAASCGFPGYPHERGQRCFQRTSSSQHAGRSRGRSGLQGALSAHCSLLEEQKSGAEREPHLPLSRGRCVARVAQAPSVLWRPSSRRPTGTPIRLALALRMDASESGRSSNCCGRCAGLTFGAVGA